MLEIEPKVYQDDALAPDFIQESDKLDDDATCNPDDCDLSGVDFSDDEMNEDENDREDERPISRYQTAGTSTL